MSIVLEQIEGELIRIGATDIKVEADPRSPEIVVRVQLGGQSGFLQSAGFLQMLYGLPDGAGSEAVRQAIEDNAQHAASWVV